jgi:hypothetical protein
VIIICLIALSSIALLTVTTSNRWQQDIDDLRKALDPSNTTTPGWHEFLEVDGSFMREKALGGNMVTWIGVSAGRECQAVVGEVAPSASWVRVNDTVIRDRGEPLDINTLEIQCNRDRVIVRFWSPDPASKMP